MSKGAPLNLAAMMREFAGIYSSSAPLARLLSRNPTPAYGCFPRLTISLLLHSTHPLLSSASLLIPECHIRSVPFQCADASFFRASSALITSPDATQVNKTVLYIYIYWKVLKNGSINLPFVVSNVFYSLSLSLTPTFLLHSVHTNGLEGPFFHSLPLFFLPFSIKSSLLVI